MSWVDRHWCKEEIEFTLTVLFDKSPGPGIQLVQTKNADAMGGERRP
jgi:hypothetical protein